MTLSRAEGPVLSRRSLLPVLTASMIPMMFSPALARHSKVTRIPIPEDATLTGLVRCETGYVATYTPKDQHRRTGLLVQLANRFQSIPLPTGSFTLHPASNKEVALSGLCIEAQHRVPVLGHVSFDPQKIELHPVADFVGKVDAQGKYGGRMPLSISRTPSKNWVLAWTTGANELTIHSDDRNRLASIPIPLTRDPRYELQPSSLSIQAGYPTGDVARFIDRAYGGVMIVDTSGRSCEARMIEHDVMSDARRHLHEKFGPSQKSPVGRERRAPIPSLLGAATITSTGVAVALVTPLHPVSPRLLAFPLYAGTPRVFELHVPVPEVSAANVARFLVPVGGGIGLALPNGTVHEFELALTD